MRLWRAAFLAAKIGSLGLLSLALITTKPVLDVPHYLLGELHWRSFLVPGTFLLLSILLWTFADRFADAIARSGAVWGGDFAARHGMDNDDTLPTTPSERKTTRDRLDLMIGMFALLVLALFLVLVLRALTADTTPGFFQDEAGAGPSNILSVVRAAVIAVGIGLVTIRLWRRSQA